MSGSSLECRGMNAGDGLLTRIGRRSGRSAAASETAHGRSGAQRARRHMAVLGLKAVWRAEEMPQLAVWTGPATERNGDRGRRWGRLSRGSQSTCRTYLLRGCVDMNPFSRFYMTGLVQCVQQSGASQHRHSVRTVDHFVSSRPARQHCITSQAFRHERPRI